MPGLLARPGFFVPWWDGNREPNVPFFGAWSGKKPAPRSMRAGYRSSEKIMRKQNVKPRKKADTHFQEENMKRRDFIKVTGLAAAGAATIAAPAIAQSMPEIKWRLTASWPKSLDTLYGCAE